MGWPESTTSVSVVLPTFNESAWLPETVARLRIAIERSGWSGTEIVVVNDGSTDATASIFESDLGKPPVRVISQPNCGRLAARRLGLSEARGDLVLFLDSRVHIDEDSLSFVRMEIENHPERTIWNGHAVTASTRAPWTRFWDGIAFLAWRRYLANPRTTSYGEDEFDWYPKGTTMFLAPREWLIGAAASAHSLSDDPKLANDDTLMIRELLRHGRINISPSFKCTYYPRISLRDFLRNARHRGAVLVDGHLRPGLRFWRPFQAVLVVGAIGLLLAIRRPRVVPPVVVGGCFAVAVGARAAGVPTGDAASLGLLAGPFSLAYSVGITDGFRSRARKPINQCL